MDIFSIENIIVSFALIVLMIGLVISFKKASLEQNVMIKIAKRCCVLFGIIALNIILLICNFALVSQELFTVLPAGFINSARSVMVTVFGTSSVFSLMQMAFCAVMVFLSMLIGGLFLGHAICTHIIIPVVRSVQKHIERMQCESVSVFSRKVYILSSRIRV